MVPRVLRAMHDETNLLIRILNFLWRFVLDVLAGRDRRTDGLTAARGKGRITCEVM